MKAEVKQVVARVTPSMDKLYKVVLETNDPKALELERFIAEDVVDVSWEGRDESN